MESLSKSYEKTLDLLDNKKPLEARDEFRTGFLLTVKLLYSESALACPGRFDTVEDWGTWTRSLYILSLKTDQALTRESGPPAGSGKQDLSASDKKPPRTADELLAALREHFYQLHKATGALKSNDAIYAFYSESLKSAPDWSAEKLREIQGSLDNAELSVKAKADEAAYRKAKTDWLDKIAPVLQKGAMDNSANATLTEATAPFYRLFGRQLE